MNTLNQYTKEAPDLLLSMEHEQQGAVLEETRKVEPIPATNQKRTPLKPGDKVSDTISQQEIVDMH